MASATIDEFVSSAEPVTASRPVSQRINSLTICAGRRYGFDGDQPRAVLLQLVATVLRGISLGNPFAPRRCFFAGTGAFLNGKKLGNKRALASYLITRIVSRFP